MPSPLKPQRDDFIVDMCSPQTAGFQSKQSRVITSAEGQIQSSETPKGSDGSGEGTASQNFGEVEIEQSEGNEVQNMPTGTTNDNKIQMKKEVGLFSAVAIITGVIVGSGIFISPQFVLKDVGSPILSLIVWLVCGFYATLGALCYAELGVMIPQCGGDYIYIYEAFGSFPAFVLIWVAVVVIHPVSIAIVSLTFSTYFANEFYGKDEEIPTYVLIMLTYALLIMVIALNCYKVRWSKLLQNICMIVKIICLMTIVTAAIVHLARGNFEQMTIDNWWGTPKYDLAGFAMAFYGGILSYSGYNILNFLTEEMQESERDLPRAIYISMPLITFIYCILNAAYFVAIPVYVFPTVRAVAYTFAANTMGIFRYIIPVGVCFSCVGTVNGVLFASSRVLFAGARNGHLPELLGMINVNWKTPIPAVITLGIFAMIYSLFTEVALLLSLFTFAMTAIVASGVLALLKLRLYDKRCPDKSLKLFIGIPFLFLAMCLFFMIMPFFRDPMLLTAPLSFILSSVPVYFFFVYWSNKPNWMMKPWVILTHFFQKLLMCVNTDDSDKFS